MIVGPTVGLRCCAVIVLGAWAAQPAAQPGIDAEVFSTSIAQAHVEVLAREIGSRPIGSPGNARARAYLVTQLAGLGYEVRLQTTDAQRPELGRTARVTNIIATRTSRLPGLIALVSHYDSAPNSPGAADDALGVAVSLEAARALLSPPLDHGLAIIVTDGEEVGLMGATALLQDPILDRVETYLNFEAIGSSGPSLLFEAGPGNAWLLGPWTRAPNPRGSSVALEIYKRLPNDTDFSILKRSRIPGLNFAAIQDSYAYHSPRDTTRRLSDATLRSTGRNAVAMVRDLDAMDLSQRTNESATYFDLAGWRGAAYPTSLQRVLTGVGIILALLALLRLAIAAARTDGMARLMLTGCWMAIEGVAALAGAATAPWAIRVVTGTYHPWHAHPDRLFLFVAAAGLFAAWIVWRLERHVPHRLHGSRHPAAVWVATLPVWIAAAAATEQYAPAASYLVSLPLLVAGFLLLLVPAGRVWMVRAASVAILAVSGLLWISPLADLMQFVTPVLSRLPIIAPGFVFPALLAGGALILGPPVIAMLTTSGRDLIHPAFGHAVASLLLVGSASWAALAPAYTVERPQRRYARFVQEAGVPGAVWEVGSTEAALDLGPGAERLGWEVADGPPPTGILVPPLRFPFLFRAVVPASAQPPGSVVARLQGDGSGLDLQIEIHPFRTGLTVGLSLPAAAAPIDSSIPGVAREPDAWTATYIATPLDGLRLRARFAPGQASAVRAGTVTLRTREMPGGVGWQRLPRWLPRDRVVWQSHSLYSFPIAGLVGSDDTDAAGPVAGDPNEGIGDAQ